MDDHAHPGFDDHLTDTEVTKVLPRREGKRLHPSSVRRWRRKGIGGVRLRFTMIGRSPRTTRRWLREFFDALAAARVSQTAPRTDQQPTDRAARSTRLLQRHGLG